MSKRHIGSSIDDFLKEEGVFEEAQRTRSKKWSPGNSRTP